MANENGGGPDKQQIALVKRTKKKEKERKKLVASAKGKDGDEHALASAPQVTRKMSTNKKLKKKLKSKSNNGSGTPTPTIATNSSPAGLKSILKRPMSSDSPSATSGREPKKRKSGKGAGASSGAEAEGAGKSKKSKTLQEEHPSPKKKQKIVKKKKRSTATAGKPSSSTTPPRADHSTAIPTEGAAKLEAMGGCGSDEEEEGQERHSMEDDGDPGRERHPSAVGGAADMTSTSEDSQFERRGTTLHRSPVITLPPPHSDRACTHDDALHACPLQSRRRAIFHCTGCAFCFFFSSSYLLFF